MRSPSTTTAKPTVTADACHLLVVLRPWSSMRRYGPPGYLYALVDAAHAATNLWGVARGDAVLRLVDGTLAESRTVRVHRPSGVTCDDVLAGCVGQRHVADARVFVVVHAAARDVLGAARQRHAVSRWGRPRRGGGLVGNRQRSFVSVVVGSRRNLRTRSLR